MDVFISFAKEDKSIVSRIEQIVRHGGGRGWQFVYDLYGARDWVTEIQYKIDRCEVFLFVITEYSLKSEWCLKELQHAALSYKPIVTVVLNSDITIPHPLNTIQYVLFDESPESGAKLTRALQDPHPISRKKIPPHWEKIGGAPQGLTSDYLDRISIPRIKHGLSDIAKEDFLYDSIQKIRDYFNLALRVFHKSDTRVETRMRDESNSAFKCQLFLDGKNKKSCMIWISENIGIKGIAYFESHGQMVSYGNNSYNELAHVTEVDGRPALEFSLGLGMFNQFDDCRICTVNKAAECLWKYFIRDFAEDSTNW